VFRITIKPADVPAVQWPRYASCDLAASSPVLKRSYCLVYAALRSNACGLMEIVAQINDAGIL
jgi:hypothetical protein